MITTTDNEYKRIHAWLAREYRYLKTHCWSCGDSEVLHFALKPGRKHEKNIGNYDILCHSCHFKQDLGGKKRPPRTAEWSAKIAAAKKGQTSPRKGAVLTEETKAKIRLAVANQPRTKFGYYGHN